MIDQINHIAQTWWIWMAAMFWQVSLLILLIGVIDWLTRKWIWPQVRYALWLMVLVKLVLPPNLAISTSVTSQILPLVESRILTKESPLLKPNMPVGGRWSRIDDFEKIASMNGRNQTGKIDEHKATQGARIEFLRKPTWQALAMAAWLLGFVLLTGCWAFKLRRLRRPLLNARKEQSMPDWFEPLLIQCTERLNLRKIPDIITTDEVKFPAVFGLLRPTILLPVNCLNKNSKSDIENILLHELAHIKRGDLFIHAVQCALQIVYWFNPLVWSMRKQVHHLREICCDATVARILRGKTSSYRQTLLESTRELLVVNMEPGLGLLGVFEHPNKLVARLKWLDKNTWRRQWLKSTIVYCLAALMLFCILPMAESEARLAPSLLRHSELPAKLFVEQKREPQFLMPLKTGRITNQFGKARDPFTKKIVFHRGMDISAPKGTDVLATANGIIDSVKTKFKKGKGPGKQIIIDHGNGLKSIYSHLAKISVKKGQSAKAGEVIGAVGSTGRSTGPHLHFEILKDNKPQNPENIVDVEQLIKGQTVGNVGEIGEKMHTKMKATVKRQNGKVWIEGVDKLAGWGKGEENTFIGSLRVALSAVGEDVSYDQLMGVSGAAFRLQIAQPEWCPSAPDATVGFNCAEPAMKALGYSMKNLRDNNIFVWMGVKKMKAAIVASIDQGRPVVAINLDGGMDWGVITGYENEGRSILCRTYDDPDGEYVKSKEWPATIDIPTKTATTPDLKDNVFESLRIAVKLANTKSFDGYASGFAAYEFWINDLIDDARFDKLNQKQLSEMIHPNAWCYYSLYDSRAAAARYLGTVKKEFKGDVAEQLATAEELYGQIADMLLEDQKQAPFPHQLKGKPWTKEMRHAEAEVLKEVLALERRAIGVFEAILSKA